MNLRDPENAPFVIVIGLAIGAAVVAFFAIPNVS